MFMVIPDYKKSDREKPAFYWFLAMLDPVNVYSTTIKQLKQISCLYRRKIPTPFIGLTLKHCTQRSRRYLMKCSSNCPKSLAITGFTRNRGSKLKEYAEIVRCQMTILTS